MSKIDAPNSDVKMSDVELKSHIRKSTTLRLSQELARAQDVMDVDAIEKLSRLDIVSYIFYLRRLAGQDDALKSLVKNCDFSKVVFFSDPEEGTRQKSVSSTPAATPGTATTFGVESLLLSFLQEERNRQERKEIEDRKVAAEIRAEAKILREKQEKKEIEAKKLAADLLEKQEQKEIEDKKLAADLREKQEQKEIEAKKLAADLRAEA